MEQATIFRLKQDVRNIFIDDSITEIGHQQQKAQPRHHDFLYFFHILVLFIMIDFEELSEGSVLRDQIINFFVDRQVMYLGVGVSFDDKNAIEYLQVSFEVSECEILKELDGADADILQDHVEKHPICIFIDYAVISLWNIPVELHYFLGSKRRAIGLGVAFTNPLLQVALINREVDEGLSEIVDGEGGDVQYFFQTARLSLLHQAQSQTVLIFNFVLLGLFLGIEAICNVTKIELGKPIQIKFLPNFFHPLIHLFAQLQILPHVEEWITILLLVSAILLLVLFLPSYQFLLSRLLRFGDLLSVLFFSVFWNYSPRVQKDIRHVLAYLDLGLHRI